MADFIQNIESKRFLMVIDELVSKQKVNSDAAFCNSVGYSPQSFSQIRKAKRDVTVDLISKLFTKYAGSPIFIFSGEGSLIIDNVNTPLAVAEPMPQMQNATVNNLREENTRLNKLMEYYLKQAELNINYTKMLEDQNKELLEKLQSIKK